MKTKQMHTPGPWYIDEDCKVWGNSQCVDGSDCGMCQIPVATSLAEDDGQEEANARLIAAAPELLFALKAIIALSDRKHDAWDAAKGAIAKAEGKLI